MHGRIVVAVVVIMAAAVVVVVVVLCVERVEGGVRCDTHLAALHRREGRKRRHFNTENSP